MIHFERSEFRSGYYAISIFARYARKENETFLGNFQTLW